MKFINLASGCVAATLLAAAHGTAWAQASIQYGRITNVQMVTQENARAQTGGALVGGVLGASLGSGRSAGNRTMTGLGGAFAGQQITRMASNNQAFEYTILVGGTSTVRMVTDEAGFRVGDCVAVERGSFNNLRLVADAKCSPPPRPAQPQAQPQAARPTPTEQRQGDACIQAKEQLLAAETDDAFDRAERRVRLLCD
jgi:outer membrane lipoprotein SlyB